MQTYSALSHYSRTNANKTILCEVPSPKFLFFLKMSPCVSHLNKEERLQQKVEEHVSNYFADTGEWMRFPP